MASQKRPRTAALFIPLALGGVALDLLSKHLVFSRLGGTGNSVTLIPGLLDFTCSENTGTAFGGFQGHNAVFIALTVVALVMVLLYFFKTARPNEHGMTAAVALIVAGAVGNLIDRIIFHHVRDFIDVHMGNLYSWPTFNVADALICTGALFLVYSSFRSCRNTESEQDEQAD